MTKKIIAALLFTVVATAAFAMPVPVPPPVTPPACKVTRSCK